MIKDFVAFLREYKVIGLALAFVIGAASNALVSSMVENIIMPLVEPLLYGETWQDFIWKIGPFSLRIGEFFAELLHFLIIAFVVFLIAKKLFKMEKIG